jgi:GNAT superfamily N-acetyltransferase
MSTITVQIRSIRAEDAEAAAKLCGELGYPADAGAVRRRVEEMAGSADHDVLVYCLNADVVGWIDIAIERHLQTEPAALIGGLVVAETVRSRGIGIQLCRAAEDWARARGLRRIRVRSNATRERTHAFYLRDGYTRVKTSAVFEKALS